MGQSNNIDLHKEVPLSDLKIPEMTPEAKAAAQKHYETMVVEAAPPEAPAPKQVTYDEFRQTDMRVGTVTKAERVPNTDRLLKLEVSLGTLGVRTIVAGLAEAYQPDQIQGKKVIVVVNLQPRKLKGIESHGMLLAADDDGGGPSLLTCSGAEGERVG
jgi:methionyl-tRNA synthetase